MEYPAGLVPATLPAIRRLTALLMDTGIQKRMNPSTTLFFSASHRDAILVELVSL